MRQREPKELRALARRGAVTVAVLGALGPSAARRPASARLAAVIPLWISPSPGSTWQVVPRQQKLPLGTRSSSYSKAVVAANGRSSTTGQQQCMA